MSKEVSRPYEGPKKQPPIPSWARPNVSEESKGMMMESLKAWVEKQVDWLWSSRGFTRNELHDSLVEAIKKGAEDMRERVAKLTGGRRSVLLYDIDLPNEIRALPLESDGEGGRT